MADGYVGEGCKRGWWGIWDDEETVIMLLDLAGSICQDWDGLELPVLALSIYGKVLAARTSKQL
jgi:hypothetical protein